MTNQQGAPEAPSYEHKRAIMEGERNASLDAYSRVVYLTQTESRIYEAAFTNGWNHHAALVEAQQPAPSAAAAVEQETDAVAKRRAKYLRNDTDAGRAYVAQYLRSMGQHYFDDYIQTDLAGDFACALASVLSLTQQAPKPSPTPQADSEPAKVKLFNPLEGGNLETELQMAAVIALRDSQPALDRARIREIFMAHGFTVKEGQTDLKQYVYDAAEALLRAARATADSQPAPDEIISMAREQGLPETEIEGVFRVNVDDLGRMFAADRAARAPADSVTAPAAGAVAGPSEAPEGWRNQFAEAVYADLEAADNQDVPLEEYPTRILKALDSIVGPRHPTVIHWRNDAIQACIAIAYRYCRDPESFQYLKQDLQALIFAAPTTQAAPADSVLEDAARLDWLDQQCEAYGFQDIHEGNRWEISGPYANVRVAIDAERAARKQGGAT